MLEYVACEFKLSRRSPTHRIAPKRLGEDATLHQLFDRFDNAAARQSGNFHYR